MDARWMEAVREAESPEELLELARAEGVELSEERAAALFEKYHPPLGELTDRELENVSGGGCGGGEKPKPKVGDTIKAYAGDNMVCCCGCRGSQFTIDEVRGDTCIIVCSDRCAKAFSKKMAPKGDAVIEGLFATRAEMTLKLDFNSYIAWHHT